MSKPKFPPEFLAPLLRFLRLVDAHDGVMSLTSLAVWIVLVKLALVHDPSLPDLAALLGSLGLYHAKRMSSAKERATQATAAAVTVDASQVTSALAEVRQAKDDLKTHTDKLRLMLDTVAIGRR